MAALTQGKAQGIDAMTNAVYESGIGGDHRAQRYYLNNRDSENWSEQVKHEHSGEISVFVDEQDLALAGMQKEKDDEAE